MESPRVCDTPRSSRASGFFSQARFQLRHGPPPCEPTERFGRVLGREEDGRPLLDTEERGEDENDAAAAAATPSDGTSEFAAALRLAMLNKRHSRGLLES